MGHRATVRIGNHTVGVGEPCFVIAEAGVNHNGDLELARQLVDVAVQAGADAVKFQTFKADRLVTAFAPKARYQVETTGSQESQLEMIRRLELSDADHRELSNYCQQRGTLFLSTPFDEESAELLDDLGVPGFKISSGDLTNLPFLDFVGRRRKPILLSTGMSTLKEVGEAVAVIKNAGCDQLILLHCVSNYPADPPDANLRAMQTMADAFQVPVGYSDHTPGIEVALAAVAMGACIIEKHFTVDRALPGPDHRASLEPTDLAALVRGVRIVEAALGHGRKEPAASEADTAAVARRSLVAARDLPAGTVLTEELIAVKRPGTGFPPAMRSQLVGRKTSRDVSAGSLFTAEMLV